MLVTSPAKFTVVPGSAARLVVVFAKWKTEVEEFSSEVETKL
jgi:hypothetical protein